MTTNIPITPDFIRTVTGGSAFPNNHPTQLGVPGRTLRDWFAGQALVGLLANPNGGGRSEDFATDAWIQADAMMAQREKQP